MALAVKIVGKSQLRGTGRTGIHSLSALVIYI